MEFIRGLSFLTIVWLSLCWFFCFFLAKIKKKKPSPRQAKKPDRNSAYTLYNCV